MLDHDRAVTLDGFVLKRGLSKLSLPSPEIAFARQKSLSHNRFDVAGELVFDHGVGAVA